MSKFIRQRRALLLTAVTLIAVFAAAFFNCASKTKSSVLVKGRSGTVTDKRDGKKYKTTVIGDMMWMAENLNYTPKSGNSWCYGDSASNCKKYGRLYDWNTAQTVCPAGWHLSSRQEWKDMLIAAGGKDVAGKALKAKTGWYRDDDDDEVGSGVTDAYGFSALPGGARNNDDGEFGGIGEQGVWWTSTEYDDENAFGRGISYDDDEVGGDYSDNDEDDDFGDVDAIEKGHALSVRCVLDGNIAMKKQGKAAEQPVKEGTVYFTDSRDNRKYRAIEIGDNMWMSENLDYKPKKGNSWCYDNDKSNCAKYGRLYDWNTATTACPPGWHLPDDSEWDDLALEVGGGKDIDEDGEDYSNDAGKYLKARSGWSVWRTGAGNGVDEYGFSALPGGHRAATKSDTFNNSGYYGYWWTATKDENDIRLARARSLDYDNNGISRDDNDIRYGLSVRCVQNVSPEKAQKRMEAEQRKIAEEQRRIEEARKAREEAEKRRIEEEQKKLAEKQRKQEEERKIREEEQKRLEKISAYFTDSRDGKKYRTVKIGGMSWLAENLNYAPPKDSGFCYKNNADSCKKYGRLYTWNTARTVCPAGWHLPTREEWSELGRAAGGERKTFENGTVDWYGAGKKLKSRVDWNDKNGTDDYGFSALPGGYVCTACNSNGLFEQAGERAYWWTASERGDTAAYYHRIGYNRESRSDNELVEYFEEREKTGLSVRCVQNAKK
jgi:uncharacterized protein (TIGR02145 family)